MVSSLPVNATLMRDVAEGLGRTTFSPAALRVEGAQYQNAPTGAKQTRRRRSTASEKATEAALLNGTISGGIVPAPANLRNLPRGSGPLDARHSRV